MVNESTVEFEVFEAFAFGGVNPPLFRFLSSCRSVPFYWGGG